MGLEEEEEEEEGLEKTVSGGGLASGSCLMYALFSGTPLVGLLRYTLKLSGLKLLDDCWMRKKNRWLSVNVGFTPDHHISLIILIIPTWTKKPRRKPHLFCFTVMITPLFSLLL